METYIFDRTFENLDASGLGLGRYETCRFVGCDFSNGDLSNFKFDECEFENCNLSMAKLVNTVFKGIEFDDCKLLGMRFEQCSESLFIVDFDNCNLNLSSFHKLRLKDRKFLNSSVREVDFGLADLTSAVFDNCDLNLTIFENTVLERVDFRTSYNYSIDPEINRIKGAKFSAAGIAGLLGKYEIEIS